MIQPGLAHCDLSGVAWGASLRPLRSLRARGTARFLANGFQTPATDEWKDFDVTAIASATFGAPSPGPRGAMAVPDLEVANDGILAVVRAGRLALGESRLEAPGVRIVALSDESDDDPRTCAVSAGALADIDTSPFRSLNAARFEACLVVEIAPGAQVEHPIWLVHLADSVTPAVWHPRVLVVAGDASRACVVELHVGPDGCAYFINAVDELLLGVDARLEHIRIQADGRAAFHVASIHVRQPQGSAFVSRVFTLGASLARTELHLALDGQGAEAELDALYVARDREHLDHRTLVDHRAPGCTSRQLYKGIIAERAKGAFHGRVVVRATAQKTNAFQMNRHLLLSPNAVGDSVPQLEILADDVRCKHGSSTGALDPDQIFYLRSRGLDEGSARRVLTEAFGREVVTGVADRGVRKAIGERLARKLAASAQEKGRAR